MTDDNVRPALGELARTFEFLLNAMERAAQEDTPADHGYAEKRRAVLEYVAQLVALAAGGAAGGHQQESDTAQDERELLARANRSRGAKDGWEIRRRRERGDL